MHILGYCKFLMDFIQHFFQFLDFDVCFFPQFRTWINGFYCWYTSNIVYCNIRFRSRNSRFHKDLGSRHSLWIQGTARLIVGILRNSWGDKPTLIISISIRQEIWYLYNSVSWKSMKTLMIFKVDVIKKISV